GLVEDGGDVGGDEVFALAQAHDHGRRVLGRQQGVGIGVVHDDDGVGAAHLGQRLAHGDGEIGGAALHLAVDEVSDDLGVGLGGELRAAGRQLLAQRQVVFDDAVVHHADVADLVRV